jgi:hypothetical protein
VEEVDGERRVGGDAVGATDGLLVACSLTTTALSSSGLLPTDHELSTRSLYGGG